MKIKTKIFILCCSLVYSAQNVVAIMPYPTDQDEMREFCDHKIDEIGNLSGASKTFYWDLVEKDERDGLKLPKLRFVLRNADQINALTGRSETFFAIAIKKHLYHNAELMVVYPEKVNSLSGRSKELFKEGIRDKYDFKKASLAVKYANEINSLSDSASSDLFEQALEQNCFEIATLIVMDNNFNKINGLSRRCISLIKKAIMHRNVYGFKVVVNHAKKINRLSKEDVRSLVKSLSWRIDTFQVISDLGFLSK